MPLKFIGITAFFKFLNLPHFRALQIRIISFAKLNLKLKFEFIEIGVRYIQKKFFLSLISFENICFEKEKPIFFKDVFHPLKERMSTYRKKYVSLIFVWRTY